MSNYCACSGGDEEYTIELNQQGPEGPQGPVGPEGFSPSISINTNTDAAYILTITNKEGSFNTPNLYGELEKLNADLSNLPNPAYLNGVILSQNEDGVPSIQLDTSKATVDTDGNLVFSASSTDEEGAETFNYELVLNPTEQRLELHDNEGNVKIVATTDSTVEVAIATTTTAGIVKPDGSTITVGVDGTISANLSNYVTSDKLAVDLQDINSKIASKLDTATYETDKATYATKEELASTDATVASIQTSLNNKLEASNIIAGANIAIDRSGNNLTISSTGGGGGGSGDVTAAGDNRFTGDNTFIGKVNIAGGALTVDGLATLNQATAQYLNAVSITSPGEINATSIKANGLRSDDIQTTENKKYLTEVDVDNQTIQIVNGKLHANIDELGNEVNDLSDRVTTLQTSKQDTLTAGANITIVDNVISAIGGGGEGGAAINDGSITTASTWSSSKINSEITTVAETKNDNIFDISKFTVVGSPTITDDGIASGFSSATNNIVKTSNINFGNNISIKIKFNSGDLLNNGDIVYRVGLASVSLLTNGKMRYGLSSNGSSFDICNNLQGNITLNSNENYLLEIVFDGSKYSMYIDNVLDKEILSNLPLYSGTNLTLGGAEGATVTTYKFRGSIDLKQFSITVDGKKVFSGLMESTKPIYDRLSSTNSELSSFKLDTDNNFSAVNSALNEKANLSDLAGYVTLTKYNELLARVVALETEINGGNA